MVMYPNRDHKIAHLEQQIAALRPALLDAKLKLQLYRETYSGEYVGGLEYTALMNKINEALSK